MKSTKDSMEQLVRSGLSQRRAEEHQKFIEDHTEINEFIQKAHQEYEKQVKQDILDYAKSLTLEEDDEEIDDVSDKLFIETIGTVREELNTIVEPITTILKKNFSLNTLIEESAKEYLKNADEIEEELKKEYINLLEEWSKRDSSVDLSEFNNEMSQILERVRTRDIFVKKVTDFAIKEDIDKAMSSSIIYMCIKQVLPTKEAFIQYSNGKENLVKNTILALSNACSTFNTDDSNFGEIAKIFYNNINIYTDALKKYSRLETQELASRIYDPADRILIT